MGARIANPHGNAISLLHGEGDCPTAERNFDFILDIFDRDAIAGSALAIDGVERFLFLAYSRYLERREESGAATNGSEADRRAS